MFFLLYKRTDNGVFMIFRRFPKIFQNCPEDRTNVPEHFSENFQRFPKIAEDFWGRPEDVSMIHQRI